MADDGYLLANRAEAAGTRLEPRAPVFDSPTFRHREDLGTGVGVVRAGERDRHRAAVAAAPLGVAPAR